MKRQGQNGFTLIELLIVIAMVGILMTIGLPMFFSYQQRAQKANFISHGRMIYRSFIAFYLEYDMYPNALAAGAEPYEAILDKTTLTPMNVDFDTTAFHRVTASGGADSYDSPDDPITNGEFYLWYTSLQYPDLRLLISQSDEIAGVPAADNGIWLDGVFLYEGDKRL